MATAKAAAAAAASSYTERYTMEPSMRSRAKANETIITMRMAAEGCALALDFILGSLCNFTARFRYFYSPIPRREAVKVPKLTVKVPQKCR